MRRDLFVGVMAFAGWIVVAVTSRQLEPAVGSVAGLIGIILVGVACAAVAASWAGLLTLVVGVAIAYALWLAAGLIPGDVVSIAWLVQISLLTGLAAAAFVIARVLFRRLGLNPRKQRAGSG